MRLQSWLYGLLLSIAGGCSVVAGEIADLARTAEAKLAAGQSVEAIEALRQALRTAHDSGSLAFRKSLFVADRPQGFGIYKPRDGNVFKKGEPIVAYVEPLGIGWVKQNDGRFHSLLSVDFEIRTPAGDILTGKRDFGRFEFNSHEQNTEVMTHLSLNLTGAAPGSYVLGVIYHDKTTGKSANLDLPFVIE